MNTKSTFTRTSVAAILVLTLGAGLFTASPAQAGGFSFSIGGGDGGMMRDDGMPMGGGGMNFANGMSMDLDDVIGHALIVEAPKVTGTAYIKHMGTGATISAVYTDDGYKTVSVNGGDPVTIKMPTPKPKKDPKKPAKPAKPTKPAKPAKPAKPPKPAGEPLKVTGSAYIEDVATGDHIYTVYFDDGTKLVTVNNGAPTIQQQVH